MAKTKPHSIRFEESEYEFIYKREGLKTAQSIIDFFMKEYMKMYKVEKPSIFKPAIPENLDGSKSDSVKSDEAGQWEEKQKRVLIRTFEQYGQLKIECENVEDWAELSNEIRNSNLSTKQKQVLLN